MKCELTIIREGESYKATAFIKATRGSDLFKTVSLTGKDLDGVIAGVVEELKKSIV